MNRLLPNLVTYSVILVGLAYSQVAPVQSVVSEPPATSAPSNEAVEPSASAADADITLDAASLLPDLPPVPAGKPTLVGGTIERLDRVQDKLTVHVFGGDKMKIMFDTRTAIYRDGVRISAAELRQGDRVYVDTMLDGNDIFARNIRLKSSAATGESQGVILSFRPDQGELLVRDSISPHPLKVRVTSSTRVTQGDRTVAASTLTPGTLVAVKFGAQQKGADIAREVSVLAVRGASFTFAGQVTFLDLHSGLLVLKSSTDQKTYEIHLDPSEIRVDDSLRQGADVTVLTRFDGTAYVARTVTINSRNP
jgi:hypothetical protein